MTPLELCQILDDMQITTRDAAAELGIHETTLGMYCAGKRYPSHGGGVIAQIPKLVANAVLAMHRRRCGCSD
jgi:hypothetical protein